MQLISQSDPRTVERDIYFTCVDTTAMSTRLQSSDMGSFVVYLTKNGVNTLLGSPTITQVDATNAKGLFVINLTAVNIDTPGTYVLVIKSIGGTKLMEQREITFKVIPAYFAVVGSTSLSVTTFSSNRTEGTDFWKDLLAVVRSGALTGQMKKIGGFTTVNGVFTLAATYAFTAALANGDVIELVND